MKWMKDLLCMRPSTVGTKSYEADIEEPLQSPEEIIEAIERSKDSGSHSEIHKIIKSRKINLRTTIQEKGDGINTKKTIARKILEEAVNGHKIVKRELDSHVTTTCDKEDSLKYVLEVNFDGVLCDDSPKQMKIVFDLLELRNENSDETEAFTDLIEHPVVATFIENKWDKAKWYFYTYSLVFVSFLLFYSSFIIYLFNRPEVFCSKLEKVLFAKDFKEIKNALLFPDYINGTEKERNACERHNSGISKPFLSDFRGAFVICEMFLLVLFVLLCLMEIYQAIKFKKQYFKDLENYVEWVVLISTLVAMVCKGFLLQKNTEAAIARGISAIGICAAWLQLILIIGRYPFNGGDFSIMFYNVIKKIIRYALAMFLMILGFAFAFMVVNYGNDQASFETPIKSAMMTLTMILGEFNFEDLYNTFKDDSSSRFFAMFLLLLLILFGTITMVNLFIAVIISDINQLRKDVYTQNLINMAQCSILVEELLPSCLQPNLQVEKKLTICIHKTCPRECRRRRMSPNLKEVVIQLEEIARRNSTELVRGKYVEEDACLVQDPCAGLVSGRTC